MAHFEDATNKRVPCSEDDYIQQNNLASLQLDPTLHDTVYTLPSEAHIRLIQRFQVTWIHDDSLTSRGLIEASSSGSSAVRKINLARHSSV